MGYLKARGMAALLTAVVSLPGWGQTQSQSRFALTSGQVAHALSIGGTTITDEQVSLLAQVVATQPSPTLDILSVEPFAGRVGVRHPDTRSLVKLVCHQPGTCLPFYAVVNWPEGTDVSVSSALGISSGANNAVAKSNAAVTMHVGTHATMVMDDDRSHIRVAVVSLESGSAGKKIHVASPDHKQIYLAEVVSANLLKRSY